MEKQYN